MNTLQGAVTWQDDSEVDGCFICGSKYTIFNRRHHCRKCGKVVCGSCSEQAIKYFPNTLVIDANNITYRMASNRIYKTCDKCVEEIRMIRTALFEGGRIDSNIGSSVDQTRSIDSAVNSEPGNDNDSITKYNTRTRTLLIRSSTHSSYVNDRQTQRDDESDANLCPVCATDLLKLFMEANQTNGKMADSVEFDRFKEMHINDCLTAFDFDHNHERFNSPNSDGIIHPRNKMLVYNMPPIPKPKYESIPNIEGTSCDTITQRIVEPNFATYDVADESKASVTSQSTIQQATSEKQKLINDHECVICLEDLKPGDKVGRLECLCVFHYKCIKDWFNKKGYGECPIHFLHK